MRALLSPPCSVTRRSRVSAGTLLAGSVALLACLILYGYAGFGCMVRHSACWRDTGEECSQWWLGWYYVQGVCLTPPPKQQQRRQAYPNYVRLKSDVAVACVAWTSCAYWTLCNTLQLCIALCSIYAPSYNCASRSGSVNAASLAVMLPLVPLAGPSNAQLPAPPPGPLGAGNPAGQRHLSASMAALRSSHVEFAPQAHHDLLQVPAVLAGAYVICCLSRVAISNPPWGTDWG